MTRRVLDAVCVDSELMDLVRLYANVHRVPVEKFVRTALMNLIEQCQDEDRRAAR
jgi:hypothetical protein